MNWQTEPPTEKQLSAIRNKQIGFGFPEAAPKTKGEASKMIADLNEKISSLPKRNNFGYNEDSDNDRYGYPERRDSIFDDDDYLDPII